MADRSFSSRLRWSILVPALAALLVALPILWFQVTRLLEETTAQNLNKSLAVLAPLVEPRLQDDPAALQEWVLELRERSDLRITVIAADGKVLADSDRTWAQVRAMDNHAGRPEVVQSHAEGSGWSVRRSATVGRDFVYAARLLRDAAESHYVLRLAEPVSGLAELSRGIAMSFLGAFAAALLLLTPLSWRLHRTLLQPVEELIRGAGGLLSGDEERRVAVPEDRELAALARALNRLADRAEEQLKALQAEQAHLSSVVRSMSEAVMVTDAAGHATLVNPSWRELFDVEGEVEGMSALDLTRQTRLERMVQKTLESGDDGQEELQLVSQPPRTVVVTSSLLSGGSGAVVAAREITPFLRLAEIRRDFVANVSHELRTPLSAIRGLAETLVDGALDDRQTAAGFTQRILKQCERLELILSDLLTLSRLEDVAPEGRDEARVDLAVLVGEAVEALEGKLAERGIELHVDLEPIPPFAGNEGALERMVLNLLENAIKYNRQDGRIELRLGHDGDETVLEVSDTGIGIPEASLERLFERFYRVDKGRSRAEGGTGLGLAIVKHAAQLHDGTVEVESVLGQGSTFRVRLPGSLNEGSP